MTGIRMRPVPRVRSRIVYCSFKSAHQAGASFLNEVKVSSERLTQKIRNFVNEVIIKTQNLVNKVNVKNFVNKDEIVEYILIYFMQTLIANFSFFFRNFVGFFFKVNSILEISTLIPKCQLYC